MPWVPGCIGAVGCLMLWSARAVAQAPGAASFPEGDSAPPAPVQPVPTQPAPSALPPAPSPPPAASEPVPTAPLPPPPAAAPNAAAAAGPAYAEPPLPPEAQKSAQSTRYVSITFSPLHLLGPIFELEIEAMVTPHFGAAVIGGIGSIKANSSDSLIRDQKFSAYELGLQLIGYPLRDFTSLQLGAELLWIKVSTENLNGQEITANAGGVAVGPFIGYKLITDAGFTFFVQGGFEYAVVKGEASDSQGNSSQDEQDAFIPLLNLNLGWSF